MLKVATMILMDQLIDLEPGQYLQVTQETIDDNGGLPYCKVVARELGLKHRTLEVPFTILLKPVHYHRFTKPNVSIDVSI